MLFHGSSEEKGQASRTLTPPGAEGDSQWTFCASDYQEYEEDRKKRSGEEGAKPKRIRHKPISR